MDGEDEVVNFRTDVPSSHYRVRTRLLRKEKGCTGLVRAYRANDRDYCEDAVQRLRDLKEIQAAAGFTLSKLKELANAYDAGELTTGKEAIFLRQKIDVIRQKIAELERVQTYLISK